MSTLIPLIPCTACMTASVCISKQQCSYSSVLQPRIPNPENDIAAMLRGSIDRRVTSTIGGQEIAISNPMVSITIAAETVQACARMLTVLYARGLITFDDIKTICS